MEAAAAVDTSTTSKANAQIQDSEAVVAAPDSISGSPTQSQEVEARAAAAASTAGETVQGLEVEAAAAAAASAASASDSAQMQEVQTRVSTIEDAQREAAIAGGTVGGVGAGAGGAARATDGRGRKAAARAAVAVMERMQMEDDAQRKDGRVYDYVRQKPRTTRDEMVGFSRRRCRC